MPLPRCRSLPTCPPYIDTRKYISTKSSSTTPPRQYDTSSNIGYNTESEVEDDPSTSHTSPVVRKCVVHSPSHLTSHDLMLQGPGSKLSESSHESENESVSRTTESHTKSDHGSSHGSETNTIETNQDQLDATDSEEGKENEEVEEVEDDKNDMEDTVELSRKSHSGHSFETCQFLTLQLSSELNNMNPLTQELASSKSEEDNLVRKRKAISKDLLNIRKRQKILETQVEENEQSMQADREAVGISRELWREYEAFCEALQPEEDMGQRSLEINEDYNESYLKYDRKFELLKSVVGVAYKERIWRCNRVASYSTGGAPIGYQVQYYTLKRLEGTTWRECFPKLYSLAIEAGKKCSTGALDMLVALPWIDDSTREGWLFEYGFKEPCSSYYASSQRWGFRTSHKTDIRFSAEAKREALITAFDLSFKR
ncbi:hypothetical protein HD806DRAFT_553269 [Xylariaceae sp. AK1471]|nr:hypothetical protein HD806DRAFT_553269 [Xylariaceae sp. AK1471]